MAQAQCPNCGGYRVDVAARTRHEPVNYGARLTATGVIFFALFIMFFLFGQPVSQQLGSSLLMATGITIPIGLLSLFLPGRKVPVGQSFECRICGYQWNSDVVGEIHVRPDLIARGAERLDEEAAAAALADAAQRRRNARR